jgi:hypothetical protein
VGEVDSATLQGSPNYYLVMTPAAKPELRRCCGLAAGLREGDGGSHLVTFKPDPAPHPAGFLHEEPWLDMSVMQTWKWVERIYPMVTEEYHLKPIKPVVMGEGAYEHGSEYGFDCHAALGSPPGLLLVFGRRASRLRAQ